MQTLPQSTLATPIVSQNYDLGQSPHPNPKKSEVRPLTSEAFSEKGVCHVRVCGDGGWAVCADCSL